mmetsp:Transcript_31390/g.69911  ORF Transcript_31390/g.69911 Transcript_31390/m.69911 type:complete len:481 (+) Transcript_31390:208-1650(+)
MHGWYIAPLILLPTYKWRTCSSLDILVSCQSLLQQCVLHQLPCPPLGLHHARLHVLGGGLRLTSQLLTPHKCRHTLAFLRRFVARPACGPSIQAADVYGVVGALLARNLLLELDPEPRSLLQLLAGLLHLAHLLLLPRIKLASLMRLVGVRLAQHVGPRVRHLEGWACTHLEGGWRLHSHTTPGCAVGPAIFGQKLRVQLHVQDDPLPPLKRLAVALRLLLWRGPVELELVGHGEAAPRVGPDARHLHLVLGVQLVKVGDCAVRLGVVLLVPDGVHSTQPLQVRFGGCGLLLPVPRRHSGPGLLAGGLNASTCLSTLVLKLNLHHLEPLLPSVIGHLLRLKGHLEPVRVTCGPLHGPLLGGSLLLSRLHPAEWPGVLDGALHLQHSPLKVNLASDLVLQHHLLVARLISGGRYRRVLEPALPRCLLLLPPQLQVLLKFHPHDALGLGLFTRLKAEGRKEGGHVPLLALGALPPAIRVVAP